MHILGGILILIFTTWGGILAAIDLFAGAFGNGGAILGGMIAIMGLTIQFILGIISFFKPKGIGISILILTILLLLPILLFQAYFSAVMEALIGLGALLCIFSKKAKIN